VNVEMCRRMCDEMATAARFETLSLIYLLLTFERSKSSKRDFCDDLTENLCGAAAGQLRCLQKAIMFQAKPSRLHSSEQTSRTKHEDTSS